jgi:hypothetical protein
VDRAVGLQRDARRSRPRRPRHVVVPRKAWRTCTCLMRGMWWWVVRWFIACQTTSLRLLTMTMMEKTLVCCARILKPQTERCVIQSQAKPPPLTGKLYVC